MQNFQALGALPPGPRASGGWGLCPQTLVPPAAGDSPPNPQPPVAGGYAPRPPKHPPIANFWLRACYKVRNRGEGYSVLVNYQLFLSNLFSLASPKLFFFINCGRNKLLRVSLLNYSIL